MKQSIEEFFQKAVCGVVSTLLPLCKEDSRYSIISEEVYLNGVKELRIKIQCESLFIAFIYKNHKLLPCTVKTNSEKFDVEQLEVVLLSLMISLKDFDKPIHSIRGQLSHRLMEVRVKHSLYAMGEYNIEIGEI